MISPDSIANPRYGILYLPTFTFLYLWSAPIPSGMGVFSLFVPDTGVYLFLAGFCFFGGILAQNLFEAIFGPEGPAVNPKFETTSLQHTFALLMDVDAEQISESEMGSILSATFEVLDKVPLSKSVRGLILITFLSAFRLLMLFTALLLGIYLAFGGADFIVGLLFIGTLAMSAQQKVSALFPESGNPESAKHLATPEYKRFENQMVERELDNSRSE